MPRIRPPIFPELEKQILMRGIRKADISVMLKITPKSLSRRLTGQAEFTLHEVEQIAAMMPGISWEILFARKPQLSPPTTEPKKEVEDTQ